jgi:SAM-dependent methyltransferase
MTNDTPHYGQYSLEFYRERASEYAALRQVFANRSHPEFREDRDLYRRLAELAVSGPGLDAGCGPGALEMSYLAELGFEMYGLDAVAENIEVARSLRPEFADMLRVADIQEPLPFDDASFEIVLCNAVIQHIPREVVLGRVLSEFARALRPGGVLQLMFKPGHGVETVVDGAYGSEGVARSFALYDERELLEALATLNLRLIEEGGDGAMGGLLYFDDNKPMRHCVFWARKD